MAQSKCGSCGKKTFESVSSDIKGMAVKMKLIQCASCGVVIGVQEHYQSWKVIQSLAKKLTGNKLNLS